MIRTEYGWEVDEHGIVEPDRPENDICELIDDSVEAVIIDGDDPETVAHAVEVITSAVVVGRVIVADRGLVRDYGLRGAPDRPQLPAWTPTDGPEPRDAGGIGDGRSWRDS